MSASGWSVYRHPFGLGWVWSAYGPSGGTQGSARTEEEAERRAQQAERDLRVGYRVGGTSRVV